MDPKLTKIEQNVNNIYLYHREALNPDKKKRLIRAYWKNYDGVTFPMSEEDHEKATPSSSILRARRKIRELHGVTDKETDKMENTYRNHYLNKGI